MAKDNQEKGNSLEGLMKYQYGAVAGKLLEQSPDAARSALEFLVQGTYLKLDEPTKEYLAKCFASEEGVKDAAQIYSNAYQKAKSSLTIGELSQYYDEILKGYLGPLESGVIKAEFGRFADENFGDISKKIDSAVYILKGKEKYKFSDEEMNKAKSTAENYKELMQLLQILEEAKLAPLMEKIQKKGISSNLKAISENLKKKQEHSKRKST